MKKQRGQSLIEVMLAAALLIILMPAIFTGILTTREGRAQQKRKINASYLLKQTQEELRIIRDRGWSLFETNGTYYPQRDGNTWTLVAGTEEIEGFTRQVIISDVYRDEFGIISQTGGIDPSTKLVDIDVDWINPFISNIHVSYFLTRHLGNLAYVETTEDDFLLGETTGTVIVNNIGGEIVLGAGGRGSWCDPANSIVKELDLPKQGIAHAISAIEGQIIAGTGENASGVSLAKVEIYNNDPQTAVITGEFDGYKTNDVFTEPGYAYIATDTNQKEISIIDISSAPFSEVGFSNLPGSVNADAIHVAGQVGYAVQGSLLWSIDLSSKAGERPLLDPDGVNLAGDATEIIVVDTYAYISLKGDIELQIIDVSNPSNLNIVAQANVDGNDGKDVSVNSTGTRSYLVTSKDADKPEFFTIDTSSKSGNQPVLGSLDTGDMDPKAVITVPGNRAIAAGHGGDEYQVISILYDNSPSLCGSLSLNSDINDLDAVLSESGNAYSYILTKDNDSELKIIEGGPGGQFSNEGTFESGIFDANYNTVFNRFQTTHSQPDSTEIKYQVAVADDVGGSCSSATYSYVGPDGTNATFFSESGAIPTNNDGVGFENPAQCFRYKVYLTSEDSIITPLFEEISINYSP